MKRALIVIDVQNEYVDGKLPIGYPSLHVSIPNIMMAMDSAADAHVPIVVVQHVAGESSPVFAKGGRGVELHESIADKPRDHLVQKTEDSAFDGTDLAEWLSAQSIDTITIVGYMTQNCDEATARDATQRGLTVELLSDATGTLDLANEAGRISAKELHASVLVVLQTGFAAVATTEAWLDALQSGAALPLSNIFASTEPARHLSPLERLEHLGAAARAKGEQAGAGVEATEIEDAGLGDSVATRLGF
ncbi:cysteine hydrolase family protein [Subtercola endophyticus]|uniref:cysteine hydrolase family protein n=1 Tax=Subtercola endophyticus TaxID=2895559 RepID=UPI0021050E0B|nr:cysteine hydrolase family protein [Subtercola endophyticus]